MLFKTVRLRYQPTREDPMIEYDIIAAVAILFNYVDGEFIQKEDHEQLIAANTKFIIDNQDEQIKKRLRR